MGSNNVLLFDVLRRICFMNKFVATKNIVQKKKKQLLSGRVAPWSAMRNAKQPSPAAIQNRKYGFKELMLPIPLGLQRQRTWRGRSNGTSNG